MRLLQYNVSPHISADSLCSSSILLIILLSTSFISLRNIISEFIESDELGAFRFVPLFISSDGGVSIHLSPLPLLEDGDGDTAMSELGLDVREAFAGSPDLGRMLDFPAFARATVCLVLVF